MFNVIKSQNKPNAKQYDSIYVNFRIGKLISGGRNQSYSCLAWGGVVSRGVINTRIWGTFWDIDNVLLFWHLYRGY